MKRRVDRLLPKLVARYCPAPVDFFRPRGTNPSKMMDTVREDVAAIIACDELWLVGDYGRDCSWEIGYAMGLGKRVVVWRDKTNKEKFDSDWMVKIGYDTELLVVYDV